MTPGKLYKIKISWIAFFECGKKYFLYQNDIILVYLFNKPELTSDYYITVNALFKTKHLVRQDLSQFLIDDWFEEL